MRYEKNIMYYSFVFLVALITLSFNKMYSQSEESVRAMWVFNIVPGVTWESKESISKYTIGVFSSEKEYAALNKLAPRLINGKPVEVIKYEKIEDIKPNHIIFVTKNENANLGFIYQKLKGKNVLIISDRSKQPQYSVINLNKPSDSKQPFTINTPLYKEQKLKFSLPLLRLGGDRTELKKIQAETNRKLLAEKKELENKKIEIAKTNKELIKAKRDLKLKDKEIEALKEKIRKCEEQK